MQISSLLIGLVLLVATLAFVNLPFRQKQNTSVRNHKKANMLHINTTRREAVLSALRDLDFDFKTGKVSEEDYTPLRAQLMAEAAQTIEQEVEDEKKLEALIQSRRANQKESIHCEQCGEPMVANQKFCAKCGAAVHKDSCPSCGQKISLSDQFCSSCGTRLEVQMEAVVPS